MTRIDLADANPRQVVGNLGFLPNLPGQRVFILISQLDARQQTTLCFRVDTLIRKSGLPGNVAERLRLAAANVRKSDAFWLMVISVRRGILKLFPNETAKPEIWRAKAVRSAGVHWDSYFTKSGGLNHEQRCLRREMETNPRRGQSLVGQTHRR